MRARARACVRVCISLELHQYYTQAALLNCLVPCLRFRSTQSCRSSQSGVRQPSAEPQVAPAPTTIPRTKLPYNFDTSSLRRGGGGGRLRFSMHTSASPEMAG